jgi:hypothetical protein
MAAAHATLRQLLAMEAVPALKVVTGRRYKQGLRVDPGQQLSPAELNATTIGDPIPAATVGHAGSAFFEIDVANAHDLVRLMVIDHLPEAGGGVEAVLSPVRTCCGIVVATGTALAIAILGNGQFIDDEIRMLRPPLSDPRQIITQTRLAHPPKDFLTGCQHYLQQFSHLNGWPSAQSSPDHPVPA